ncbi:unnamed protein product [Ambrosiozyma monospora]|uniref:Unnamed protein product n=1 Tax=Ambrosiozyma monospora TaxID=43982 RepID=A0A9W6YUN6_AMBMO|nr:unnamed protein product [Ambrosiozyma monospora]
MRSSLPNNPLSTPGPRSRHSSVVPSSSGINDGLSNTTTTTTQPLASFEKLREMHIQRVSRLMDETIAEFENLHLKLSELGRISNNNSFLKTDKIWMSFYDPEYMDKVKAQQLLQLQNELNESLKNNENQDENENENQEKQADEVEGDDDDDIEVEGEVIVPRDEGSGRGSKTGARLQTEGDVSMDNGVIYDINDTADQNSSFHFDQSISGGN